MSMKPMMLLPIASSRTRTVQSLSLALWAIPVLASSFYLAVRPLGAGAKGHSSTMEQFGKGTRTNAIHDSSFMPPMSGLIEGSEMILQTRFAFKAEKSQARVPEPAIPRRRVQSPVSDGRTVNFTEVKIVGPNRIEADGMTITLADIVPPADGAMCKRLDGVVESCAERAANRLAVLAQDRQVRCKVWTSSDDRWMGRCSANRLDLAKDLIRTGLGSASKI